MIDAIWLLNGRALLDYVKAATSWLLTRTGRDEKEHTMKTATIENNLPTIARKIGYAITSLVFVFIVCPLFVFGAYTILTSLINL
ncbi:MAG: hypothetical protein ACR2RD_11965 [Woeseiaceae bacterium]